MSSTYSPNDEDLEKKIKEIMEKKIRKVMKEKSVLDPSDVVINPLFTK